MSRNKHYSTEERRIVLRLKRDGQSLRSIARTMGRSLYFVQNALKLKQNMETHGSTKIK